jgi:hypothetical protein
LEGGARMHPRGVTAPTLLGSGGKLVKGLTGERISMNEDNSCCSRPAED